MKRRNIKLGNRDMTVTSSILMIHKRLRMNDGMSI